ncbi:hemin receptor [Paraneptunicella aestuarii]|uniref:globin family protein n=1 Tax=Paraneptunicella aestuarii TaxID=2831148 RepID=UPI001E4E150F|nr:globin family protein [Paraneptunicella aestuarii]UAA38904.1 hemin receptor [Paraneptunicella aestuarii]
MSLSEQQVTLIQESFKKVVPIAPDAARIFYAKLFEYDPELKALFKSDMDQQGQKLMKTLGVAVAGLRDLSALVPALEGLAVKHLDYGVKIEDYTPVGNALIYTLKEGLQDGFDDATKEAWITLLRTVIEVMRKAAYPGFSPETYNNTKQYHH